MTAGARYTTVAITLHWLIAALVLLNVAAALVAGSVGHDAAKQIMANHVAFGLTVLMLSLLRIVWRVTHRPPPLAPGLKIWEVALAHATHTAFYLLIVAIPLTGWMMVSAHGAPSVGWFGLFDVPALPVPTDHASAETLESVHGKLAWGTLALLSLHVAGALKHQLLDGDGTLGRMVPWLRRA